MKSNFIQRAVTGLLFVAVIVGCTLYSAMTFCILFALIGALSVHEFVHLLNRSGKVRMNATINALSGAYLSLSLMSFCSCATDARIFLPYLALQVYLMIRELYLKNGNVIGNWAGNALGQTYVALPFALLGLLAFHHAPQTGDTTYNPILPLSVFVFIWLSDTGAYCIGTLMGRHRLFERISPKKSWEGSIGGFVFAMLSAWVFAHFFSFLSTLQWMGLSATVVVFGTWGDLTESLMKRQLGIKDSGTILPGHGGMLDRFDSALMAIPAAVAYLYLLTL